MNAEDEVVRRAAEAIGWSWDRDALTAAKTVLAEALKDLPTQGGYSRWTDGRVTLVAYPSRAVGRGEVESIVDGAVEQLTAVEAETRGLMYLAAARRSRRDTHEFDHLVGEQA